MKPTWRARHCVSLFAGHVGDFVAGDSNAAVRGDVEAAEQVEQSGLAGSAGAHEGDEIALVHVEVQALQHLNFLTAAAIGLVQAAHLDEAVAFSVDIHSNHFDRSCFCFSALNGNRLTVM